MFSPVPGNLKGTLYGWVAGMVVLPLYDAHTLLNFFQHFISSAPVCTFLEGSILTLLAVTIASIVNYFTTHFAALGWAASIYNAAPETFPEYPTGKNAGSKTGKM